MRTIKTVWLLLVLLLALPLAVSAQIIPITTLPVTVAWTDPNTPPTNSYRVYIDNTAIGTATVQSFNITSLTPGPHAIAITCFTSVGESLKSAPLQVTYNAPPVVPNPPTGLKVITQTTVSVPPNASVTDTLGGIWTLSGTNVLRNGTSAGGGIGSQIWLVNGIIYVFGGDTNWYQWNGNPTNILYINLGPTRPF